MVLPDIPAAIPIVGSPPLGFRFLVTFFDGGTVPNPVDILFSKVSGLGGTVTTYTMYEGGYSGPRQLPKSVDHPKLQLQRGLMMASPLAYELMIAMNEFRFKASHILVVLLDNTKLPIASWLFMKAYPISWSISDLDANTNSVVIEHIDFFYESMQPIRI